MSSLRVTAFFIILGSLFHSLPSHALDLDWHGLMRVETNWLWGYSNGNLLAPVTQPSPAPVATVDNGYAVPNNGDTPASFQNLFFDLSPRVIVSDNVSIKADLWLGLPDTGMFGSDQGLTSYYFSTRTGNGTVKASTYYTEIATDFGTFTVGRAPLNWGLGLVWNYDNNGTGFYRAPSTGDTIKLMTKLGAFRFSPMVVKYRMGSDYGGTAVYGATSTNPTNTSGGASGAGDYAVSLTYDNDDEQLKLGVLFMRRLSGPNASIQNAITGASTSSYAYNVWDFSAKKKSGIFTMAAEVPLVTGIASGVNYSSVAGAAKVDAQLTDHWKVKLNLGTASGQASAAAGTTPGTLTAFYYHPDYRPSLILFNYNMQNFSNGNASPYDSPITNARFATLSGEFNAGKWTHSLLVMYAFADQTADGVAGNLYFNSNTRQYATEATGVSSQSNQLGTEFDYGVTYEWDEAVRFGVRAGLWQPGAFYQFSNSSVANALPPVFAGTANMSVTF